MDCKEIIFSQHAIIRMFERSISKDYVRSALKSGVAVEVYENDFPYPSALICLHIDNRFIHVVAAKNSEDTCVIITAYIPDKNKWNETYTGRVS